uniref:26S proteasome non-ATPase regulatory subunit 5 n=1 Tax=Mesocestoides corti TaxID=53468 RepID=A0A5K3EIN4_MESCO
MTQLQESASEIIDRVSRQPGSVQDYEKLNIILRNMSKAELQTAVSSHGLLDIFGQMDLSNSVLSDLALSMASVIFSTFHLTEFVHSHESELFDAISSRNHLLRDFIISRLEEGVKNTSTEDLCIPEKLLIEISKIATQEEIENASSSLSFIKTFGVFHPQGVKILLGNPSVKNNFIATNNDEQIIRVSELFAEIAAARVETFDTMVESAFFDPLFTIFQKDDPLLQLNSIAVLKLLVTFQEGRSFLQSKGTITALLSTLQSIEENPLCDLVLPGYLTFFGALAASEPLRFLGTSSTLSPLTSRLSISLSSPNPTILLAALEAISFICRTSDGKMAVAPHLEPDGCLALTLSKLSGLIQNSSTELLPRILSIMSDLLRLPRSGEVSDILPAAQVTWNWFTKISNPVSPARLLVRIWNLARQPFRDVRLGAFQLLEAIATGVSCMERS